MDSYWINRTLCEVLEEMRKCYETRNFAPIAGLVEEVQIFGNRMEAAISDQKDLVRMNDEWRELKKKIKVARKELEKLNE